MSVAAMDEGWLIRKKVAQSRQKFVYSTDPGPLLPLFPLRAMVVFDLRSGGARKVLTGLRPLTSEGLSEAGRTSLLAWRLSLVARGVR